MAAALHGQGLIAAIVWSGGARVTVSWGPPPSEPGSGSGEVVSQIRDPRTGYAILVRGDTSAADANAWLAANIAADGERGLTCRSLFSRPRTGPLGRSVANPSDYTPFRREAPRRASRGIC